jgi:hypothetical protein
MADDPLQAEMALTWKAVEELAESLGRPSLGNCVTPR